jgi:hypothetical protein
MIKNTENTLFYYFLESAITFGSSPRIENSGFNVESFDKSSDLEGVANHFYRFRQGGIFLSAQSPDYVPMLTARALWILGSVPKEIMSPFGVEAADFMRKYSSGDLSDGLKSHLDRASTCGDFLKEIWNYRENGKPRRAEEQLQLAIQSYPEAARPYEWKAWLLAIRDHWETAWIVLEDHKGFWPDPTLRQAIRLQCLLSSGQIAEAFLEWQQSRVEQPFSAEWLMMGTKVLLRNGYLEHATSLFNELENATSFVPEGFKALRRMIRDV